MRFLNLKIIENTVTSVIVFFYNLMYNVHNKQISPYYLEALGGLLE